MKKLLAVGLTMALVLGTSIGAMAFDLDRVAAPASVIQDLDEEFGVTGGKDYCGIWCDELAGWIWIWGTGGWLGAGGGFAKFVDPYVCDVSCLPPYFPFFVDYIRFVVGIPDAPNDIEIHGYWTISEAVPDTVPCGFSPGAPVYTSGEYGWILPAGFIGTIYHYPEMGWFRMDGPMFFDFHITYISELGYFTLITDAYSGARICENWMDIYSLYYYNEWQEFYYWWGIAGDLLFWVYGYPAWNVAVQMAGFEAVPGDNMVTLNWQTKTEINNASWTIKRDGETIRTLEGQGNKETPTLYTEVDRNVVNGATYSYTLEATNYEGNVDVYGPITATPMAAGLPSEFALSQNYPNPFNASTVIRYSLAADEHVSLKIYNINGQEMATLLDADQKAGIHSVQWNGKGVSSGVYFYTLTAGDFSETKKMVYTK